MLTVLVFCYIAGAFSYYLFSSEQAIYFISMIDPRVVEPTSATVERTIILAFASFFVVYMLGMNPILLFISKLTVALRICFFGLASIILLLTNEDLVVYGVWWFPFQFLYCIISLVFVYRLQQFATIKKSTKKKQQMMHDIPFLVSSLQGSFLCYNVLFYRQAHSKTSS